MKHRKLIGSLLALALVLSLAVCGAPAALAEDAEQAEPIVLSDIDTQLELIYSQITNLLQVEGEQPWYYAITDLNHDGSLEFIAASQHPTDRSTNLRLWEVSEDRSALVECRVEKDPEESFPDIMTDNTDTFHNTEDELWSYLFYDHVVISDTEIYTSKSAFNFKDGVISYRAFAVEHTVVENGLRTVSYTDMEGNVIDAKAYLEAGHAAFEKEERSSTGFEWLTVNEARDFSRLVESYRVFIGERKPTENFPVPAPAALSYPEATPAPSPTPDPGPTYLKITKNPTNENRKVGSTARFVACANAFDSLEWVMVSPKGAKYTPQQFASSFSGAKVSGLYSTTLSIENVSADMNCWGAYCVFRYRGQVASTCTAYIYVKEAPPSPEPEPQGGSLDGQVTDFGYEYVTVHCPGYAYFTINMQIVRFAPGGDEIYIGAPATVYYDTMGAKGPNITSCIVTGREPAPAPQEACQNGRAFHEPDGRIMIGFNDGSSIYLDAPTQGSYRIKCYGGDITELPAAGSGARCTVYYRGELKAENVYLFEVYIDKNPEPDPEPAEEPVVDYDPDPIPEPEPSAEVVTPEDGN